MANVRCTSYDRRCWHLGHLQPPNPDSDHNHVRSFPSTVVVTFVPQGELTKTKLAFDRLQCGKTEAISAFNDRWRKLRMILDADPLRPSDQILADTYILKVSNNTSVSLAFASFRYANRVPLTFQQTMRIFEDLDN